MSSSSLVSLSDTLNEIDTYQKNGRITVINYLSLAHLYLPSKKPSWIRNNFFNWEWHERICKECLNICIVSRKRPCLESDVNSTSDDKYTWIAVKRWIECNFLATGYRIATNLHSMDHVPKQWPHIPGSWSKSTDESVPEHRVANFTGFEHPANFFPKLLNLANASGGRCWRLCATTDFITSGRGTPCWASGLLESSKLAPYNSREMLLWSKASMSTVLLALRSKFWS